MISKKVALLGMWGVGKTSLVQRFIHSIFAEKYHSTLGVKVDKKVLNVSDAEMTLMLWDIAGAEDHFTVPLNYVRGAAGYLLVIDGTRRKSLQMALDLVKSIDEGIGRLPFIPVINKSDLAWTITDGDISEHLEPFSQPIFKSSAKTGENVEAAFSALARAL